MPYLYIYMYPSHRLAADQSSAEAPIEVLEAMRIESTELPRVGVMATVASARSFNNNVRPFDHTFDDRGVQFVQDHCLSTLISLTFISSRGSGALRAWT